MGSRHLTHVIIDPDVIGPIHKYQNSNPGKHCQTCYAMYIFPILLTFFGYHGLYAPA
jgi:hypothetical protein